MNDPAVRGERLEGGAHRARIRAEPPDGVLGGEGRVRPCVPRCEIVQGVRSGLGERGGDVGGDQDVETVAQPPGVLDGRHVVAAGDRQAEHAALALELFDRGGRIAVEPRRDLVVRERAEIAHQVVHAVDRSRMPTVGQPLQLQLHLVERGRVQQLAEVLGPEEIAEQVAIERQRRRAPFGERRVPLVHVDRDPPEQQRLRER